MSDQDRRWLAREVVRGLVKALSSRNKELDRAEFARLVRGFLARHGPLRLAVEDRALVLAGESVKDERANALALALTTGGVREITIEPRATDEELARLLVAIDTDDQDAGARLLDGDFANVDVGLFEFADRIEKPAALGTEGEARIAAMRERRDALVAKAVAAKRVGAGPLDFDLSDSGGELERLSRVAPVAVAELAEPDVPREELLAFRARALEASQPSRVLLDLASVVIEGLALDPEAVGEANARWFLEAAPALALRTGDLGLLASLLERYTMELTVSGGAVAAALNSVLSSLSSRDGLEKLIAIGTSGTAEGGATAFCAVLEALGQSGVSAALTAYRRTDSKELRDALNKFLADNVAQCPEQLKPLLDETASADTAKWALFLVSKSVKGASGEQLLEAGRRHPVAAVSEYATFLWKTATPKGRLTALLEAIDETDVTERIRAADALAKAKDPEALAPLVKLVEDASFLERPPEEMKAFMNAISAIGGPQTIAFFEKQSARSSGIFKLRAGNEVREQAKDLLRKLIAGTGAEAKQ